MNFFSFIISAGNTIIVNRCIFSVIEFTIATTRALHATFHTIPIRIKTPCPQGFVSIILEDDALPLFKAAGADKGFPTLLQEHGAIAKEAHGHPDRPMRETIQS